MTERRVLALDLGKTGCRAALFVDGVRVADARGRGAVGLASADGAARAMAAITAATDDPASPVATRLAAGGGAGVDAVSAGLAGFGQGGGQANELVTALAERFGTGRIVLSSDMTSAHAGALHGEPGVVVAAGTGAVAMAITPDGGSHVVDGWGFMLGDDGSGYAIGRAGLDAVLRGYDGRGSAAIALHARAVGRFGPLGDLPAVVFGADNPPALVAGFARDVADAARAGDPVARRIWADAGRALAVTTAAALARASAVGSADGPALACVGGLFDAGPLLTEPFDRELAALAPWATRSVPRGDALDGAYLIVERPDVPHRRLTTADAAPGGTR